MVLEGESVAGAVEAFGDALAHRNGHNDGSFLGKTEKGADLNGVKAFHGAAVEAGRLDGKHKLSGGQGHAFVDPRIADFWRHLLNVLGHLVAVVTGSAFIPLCLKVGDHGGSADIEQIWTANKKDELR